MEWDGTHETCNQCSMTQYASLPPVCCASHVKTAIMENMALQEQHVRGGVSKSQPGHHAAASADMRMQAY